MDQQEHGDLIPQYALAVLVNVMAFTYGSMTGWLAPMQPLLQANYTVTNTTSPLGETVDPLTHEDVSWIGGFFCIGGMIGTPLYGYFADAIGRKLTLVFSAVPFIAAFALFLLATSANFIFAARFIAGVAAGGVCVIVPMYIGETAETVIRGALGSYFNLFISVGILASFIVGSYTSYTILGLFLITCPILFTLASIWVPETPIYSLMNNKKEAALNALIKLRGASNRELIEKEMSNLTTAVKEMAASRDQGMSLREMLSDVATRRGLVIGGVLMAVQQLSGISPILNFTVMIFEASGSDLSPHLAAIIVGVLQFVGAVFGTIFMDRAGRKFLLMISAVGMALTLTPMALYFHLKSIGAEDSIMASIGWVPVTSMAAYIVLFAVGFGPVPFVLVAELFRTEARGTATSICVLLVWFVAFLLLKFFSYFQNLLGIDACFALFALFCVFGAAFTYFYIPETKGKSLEMILWELGGKKECTPNGKGCQIPLVDIDGNRNGRQEVELQTEITEVKL